MMKLEFEPDPDDCNVFVANGDYGTFKIACLDGKGRDSSRCELDLFNGSDAWRFLDERRGSFEDCVMYAQNAEDAVDAKGRDEEARDWYYDCQREQRMMGL